MLNNTLDYDDLMQNHNVDDPEIMYQIGLCFQHGYATKIDNAQAKHWFEKARENGYVFSGDDLKGLNLSEEEKDGSQETDYDSLPMSQLYSLAEAGDDCAKLYIANKSKEAGDTEYMISLLNEIDISSDHDIYGEAQYRLAFHYIYEHDDIDAKRGFTHAANAAELGYQPAFLLMSDLYIYGTGTEANIDSAIKWREKWALNGSARNKAILAYEYREGKTYKNNAQFQQSTVKSQAWLERAIQQAIHDIDIDAHYSAVTLKINPFAQQKDVDQAIKIIEAEAFHWYTPIAVMYYAGSYTERNVRLAKQYIEKGGNINVDERSFFYSLEKEILDDKLTSDGEMKMSIVMSDQLLGVYDPVLSARYFCRAVKHGIRNNNSYQYNFQLIREDLEKLGRHKLISEFDIATAVYNGQQPPKVYNDRQSTLFKILKNLSGKIIKLFVWYVIIVCIAYYWDVSQPTHALFKDFVFARMNELTNLLNSILHFFK